MGKKPKRNKEKKKKNHPNDTKIKKQKYLLMEGKGSIYSFWQTLDNETKTQVLNVSDREVIDDLIILGCYSPELESNIRDFITNENRMTTLRFEFTTALRSSGHMEIPHDPVVLVVINILERHLLFMYTHKNVLCKLFILLTFFLWKSTWHWLVRLVSFAFLCYASQSSRSSIQACKEWVIIIFWDCDAERMDANFHVLLSGIFVLSYGSWLSWFHVAAIIALVPLLLIEIEKFTPNSIDSNALKYIGKFFMIVSQLMLLYICWYSWLVFFFASFFFFTGISYKLMGYFLGIISVLLMYRQMLIDRIDVALDPTQEDKCFTPWNLALWACFVFLLICYYWSWKSWLWIVVNFLFMLLFMPATPSLYMLHIFDSFGNVGNLFIGNVLNGTGYIFIIFLRLLVYLSCEKCLKK